MRAWSQFIFNLLQPALNLAKGVDSQAPCTFGHALKLVQPYKTHKSALKTMWLKINNILIGQIIMIFIFSSADNKSMNP